MDIRDARVGDLVTSSLCAPSDIWRVEKVGRWMLYVRLVEGGQGNRRIGNKSEFDAGLCSHVEGRAALDAATKGEGGT